MIVCCFEDPQREFGAALAEATSVRLGADASAAIWHVVSSDGGLADGGPSDGGLADGEDLAGVLLRELERSSRPDEDDPSSIPQLLFLLDPRVEASLSRCLSTLEALHSGANSAALACRAVFLGDEATCSDTHLGWLRAAYDRDLLHRSLFLQSPGDDLDAISGLVVALMDSRLRRRLWTESWPREHEFDTPWMHADLVSLQVEPGQLERPVIRSLIEVLLSHTGESFGGDPSEDDLLRWESEFGDLREMRAALLSWLENDGVTGLCARRRRLARVEGLADLTTTRRRQHAPISEAREDVIFASGVQLFGPYGVLVAVLGVLAFLALLALFSVSPAGAIATALLGGGMWAIFSGRDRERRLTDSRLWSGEKEAESKGNTDVREDSIRGDGGGLSILRGAVDSLQFDLKCIESCLAEYLTSLDASASSSPDRSLTSIRGKLLESARRGSRWTRCLPEIERNIIGRLRKEDPAALGTELLCVIESAASEEVAEHVADAARTVLRPHATIEGACPRPDQRIRVFFGALRNAKWSESRQLAGRSGLLEIDLHFARAIAAST